MSVNIVSTPAQSTWLQRLTGSEPSTTVHETSTTTITSQPGGHFSLGTALRNGGIGAAVAGALGGVSLLGHVALPLIGKIGSVSGLVRLAGVGGALGVATAALPLVLPAVRNSPTAKAAVTGAAIGAAAGAILPLMPIGLGAAIGAGVALLIKHRRDNPGPDYPVYPGYQAYPGFAPYGTNPGAGVPNGLVPVTPNYGMAAGTAMNPYGNVGGYGLPQAGYGVAPAGYGMAPGVGYGYPGVSLPMTAGAAQAAPVAQAVPTSAPVPAAARPVAARAPKFKGAKSFTDGAGNLRQVGTGTIIRAAKPGSTVAPSAGIGMVPSGTAAPIGLGSMPVSPFDGTAPGAMPAMPTA
jgi:hypothetical protein